MRIVKLVGWVLLLAACTATNDVAVDDFNLNAKAHAIDANSFRSDLTRAFIRGANANLDDATFGAKWNASLESSVMFMRAYPGAYHKDLAQIDPHLIVGREGLCLGDPHPDNFGFIRIDGQTRFVFNDLDDSGPCPVGLDAVRYFAVLRLYFDDKSLTADTLEQYVDTVKEPARAQTIDHSLEPDWSQEAAQTLIEATKSNLFILGGEVEAPSSTDRAAVLALAKADKHLSAYRVFDVASLARSSGGSGGLRRYWILAESSGQRTIVEFKESATPGVNLGRQSAPLAESNRLPTLKSTFWNSASANDYFDVALLSSHFLVRDRLAKKSVKLDKLGRKDLQHVLNTQVSEMARVHRNGWSEVKKDDIRAWLDNASDTLAARWKKAYKDNH